MYQKMHPGILVSHDDAPRSCTKVSALWLAFGFHFTISSICLGYICFSSEWPVLLCAVPL